MRSATSQFDAALAYARALAATSGNGATLVFERRTGADGTVLRGFKMVVYSGRPAWAGAMQTSLLPPVESGAQVTEARLGGVPFAVFLDGAGHASAMAGEVEQSGVLASDPGCPSGESRLVLTFADPRGSDIRTLACNVPDGGVTMSVPAP